jgi:LPXTG-motif cell wall-anchored protein
MRRRGLALLAAFAILGVIVLGSVSTASADDYTPSVPSSSQSVAPTNSSNSTPGTLPRTGSNSTIPFLELGVVLVLAGGFLVLVARKRSERAPTA